MKTYSLVILFLLLASCAAERPAKQERVLNIYNWEDYLAPDTISKFEEEFNVSVNLHIFEDESYMLSDVQSNPNKYDIIVATNSLIGDMISLHLLATLDQGSIPNLKNIGKEFKNLAYDPGNRYSVPYTWGTTGVAYNVKYIPEADSWSVLFDQEYEGKISMLNSKEEVISAAFFYDGHPLHEHLLSGIDKNHLERIRTVLLKQKLLLRGYEDPITIRDSMIHEELWAAQMYSGDAQFAKSENDNIRYIIPKEGATIWIDNLAIPIEARHKEIAEAFINFVLRPDIGAEIANYVQYATPNEAAKGLVDQELLDDPMLYPPAEVLRKLEPLSTPSKMVNDYNRLWSDIQR